MPLKIQLINEAQGVENVTPDPEGLNDFEIELKRSEKNDGVFFEFGIGLKFFKKSRKFIRDVYEAEGIEGVIQINIYEYLPNEYKFAQEPIYSGQLRLKDYEVDEVGVQLNVEQKGLERTFLNQEKVDRVINPSIDIEVPAKTILKRFEGLPSSSNEYWEYGNIVFFFDSNDSGQSRSATRYLMPEIGERQLDEINSINDRGLDYAISQIDALHFLEVQPDEQGLCEIDLSFRNAFNITGRLVQGNDVDVVLSGNQYSTHTPPITIKLFFEHRSKTGFVKEKTQMGSTYDSTTATTNGFGNNVVIADFETRQYYNAETLLESGDRLFAYYEIELSSDGFVVAGQPASVQYDIGVNADLVTFNGWKFEVDVKTQFPATDTQCVLPFELFNQLIVANTRGLASLKSDFLGRTDLGYAEDGQGSLIANTNGNKLRLENNKKIFTNWLDAFETYNAMYCLGWGFETDENGNNFIRIEKKEYFYDKTVITLDLLNVSELKKSAKQELYYSQVECGYPEFENIDTANAIDEFNSRRRYVSSITQASNKLELLSVYRASSFEIESQRRKSLGTEDSKLDDEMFMIALKRVGSDLEVETGVDFTGILNVIDPDTAFNIRLRPSEFIKNWKSVLAGSVFRSQNKAFEFTYGTNNYFFTVDEEREDDDVVFSNEQALWLCDQIEFSTALRTVERKLLRDNPRALIVVRDWQNKKIAGYLYSAKTVLEENKADFVLLKANVNLDELN